MRTLSAVPTKQNSVQNYLQIWDTSLYRTASWVPVVSTIEVPLHARLTQLQYILSCLRITVGTQLPVYSVQVCTLQKLQLP